jgi:hypothetical protein
MQVPWDALSLLHEPVLHTCPCLIVCIPHYALMPVCFNPSPWCFSLVGPWCLVNAVFYVSSALSGVLVGTVQVALVLPS